MYRLLYTKQSLKDAKKLKKSNLKEKALQILNILQTDPWKSSPPFKRLIGDLEGVSSRRINVQHRIVYQVLEKESAVKILRMWTHYE